jgi:hypothetical protein
MLADLGSLNLPLNVEGVVGLQFLRQFRRWGGERVEGGWEFVVEDDSN